MLRVCLVINSLQVGGAEKQLAVLARGLRERGADVQVLVLFDGGAFEGDLRESGIPVTHLRFGRRSRQGRAALFASASAFVRLVRQLRRLRPDVVHTHLWYADIAGVLAARLARVPAIVSTRHGIGTYASDRWPAKMIARTVVRGADTVVAVSAAVEQDVRGRHGAPAGKVVTVHNGLPDSAFSATAAAPLDTPLPVIVSVANLHPYKGLNHLLDAVALLKERGVDCTTLLLGEGRERAALEEQIGRLGIDARLLGTRADVAAWLHRADVFVLPSLHEGLPLSVMEAMAAGLPVVASKVGGLPEMVGDRGLLTPPGDAEALADAIQRLLKDPELAGDLATRARAWSSAHLRSTAMVDAYQSVYRRLTSAQQPQRSQLPEEPPVFERGR